MMPDHMQKWLRQQSKDFCVAGFDALKKRWNKCISVGGEYVEKLMFSFPGSDVLKTATVKRTFLWDVGPVVRREFTGPHLP
jgi:hypothetical protein